MNPPGPPLGLFPHVLDFCRSISPASEPVDLSPDPGPEDVSLDCFMNVRRRVESEGGKEVLGRRIWEHYGLMIEAEVHSVWQRLDGVLRDVTPCEASPKRILFLPDASLQYDGRQINNVRRPLVKNSKILDFIRLCDEEFEILNKGERAYQHGKITLSKEEGARMRKLELQKGLLMLQIEETPPGRNELCRCGKGRKFKHCCGRNK